MMTYYPKKKKPKRSLMYYLGKALAEAVISSKPIPVKKRRTR